jgi:hypothetical protein
MYVEGSCTSWSQFKNSLVLPISTVSFVKLAVYFRNENFEKNAVAIANTTCAVKSTIRSLVTAMYNGQSFESQCNGNSWRVVACSTGPRLCINCKASCSSDACPGVGFSVNPCGTCSVRASSGTVVQAIYAEEELYPLFLAPLNITTSRTSISIVANVSSTGLLTCAAILSSSLSVTSIVTISSAGKQSFAAYPLASMVFSNLIPSATYSVYCYTQDFGGRLMPLSTALLYAQSVSTLCCKTVTFQQTYSQIIQYIANSGRTESVFGIAVDVPTTTVRLTVSVVSVDCTTGSAVSSSSQNVASPSQFTFYANSPSFVANFVVRSSLSGCVQVKTSTATADRYTVASVQVSVANVRIAPSVPQILSAQLSNDGRSVLVVFDSNTDQGSSVISNVLGSFPCSNVTLSKLFAAAKCSWSGQQKLTASFTSYLPLGATFLLRPKTIKAACQSLTDCTQYSYCSGGVNVSAPVSPVVPNAVLIGSSSVGRCDSISVDPTSSSGMIGSSWAGVSWSVSGSGSGNFNSTFAPIASYLRRTYANSTRSVVIIPSSLLKIGTYVISLKLTNVYRQTSAGSITVSVVANMTSPQIQISGATSLTQYRWQSTQMIATVAYSACYTPYTTQLSIGWKVYKNFVYMPSIVSVSTNTRTFQLNPYTLDASSVYTVQAVVAVGTSEITINTIASTAVGTIYVGRAGVVATIAGGAVQTKSTMAAVVFNASSSYDADYPANSGLLTFSWSCAVYSPNFGSSCGVDMSSRTSSVITIAAQALAAQTYNFSVIVSNGISSSTANVLLTMLSQNLPTVSMAPVQSKYNPAAKIVLTGSIGANAGVGLVRAWWTSNRLTETQLNAVSLSPSTTVSTSTSFQFQLSIAANALVAGLTYNFQLNTAFNKSWTASSTSYASATAVITMNTAPTGGLLTSSPSTGTALATIFSLLTSSWNDDPDDYPLYYTIGFYSISATQMTVLKPSGPSASTSTVMGQGLSSLNYVITCVAVATDSFGATANVTNTVTVSPPQSSAEVNSLTTSGISSALSSQNYDGAAQIISVSSASIRNTNCNVPTPCSQLNRQVCSATARTCGPCLAGYVGAPADANSKCSAASSKGSSKRRRLLLSGSGASCSSGSSCVSGTCINGQCTALLKTCPNSCTNANSGTCIFTDYYGNTVSSCSADDMYCHATCQCKQNQYGKDCSLQLTAYQQGRTLANTLCSNMLNLMEFQTVDSFVVTSRATTIANIFVDPNLVTVAALNNCSEVLMSTVAQHAAIACEDSVSTAVIAAYAAFFSSTALELETNLRDQLTSSLIAFSQGCQSGFVLGSSPIGLISGDVRLLSSVAHPDALSLNPPLTDLESVVAIDDELIQFAVNSSSSFARSALGVTLIKTTNYLMDADTISAGVNFQLNSFQHVFLPNMSMTLVLPNIYPQTDVEIGLSTLPIIFCNASDHAYYVNVSCPNGEVVRATCPGGRGTLNITCPGRYSTNQCLIRSADGSSPPFRCSVQTATLNDTTCLCYTTGEGQLSRRLNRRSLTWSSEYSTSVMSVYTTRTVTTIQIPEPVWSAAPLVNIHNDFGVYHCYGLLIGMIILGFVPWRLLNFHSKSKTVPVQSNSDPYISADSLEYIFDNLLIPMELRPVSSDIIGWGHVLFEWAALLFREHPWANLVFRAPVVDGKEEAPSSMNGFKGSIRMVAHLFSCILLLTFILPNRNECNNLSSASDCNGLKAHSFDLGHWCEWNSYYEECYPRDPSFSIESLFKIIVVVSAGGLIISKVIEYLLVRSCVEIVQIGQAHTEHDIWYPGMPLRKLLLLAAANDRFNEKAMNVPALQETQALSVRATALKQRDNVISSIFTDKSASSVIKAPLAAIADTPKFWILMKLRQSRFQAGRLSNHLGQIKSDFNKGVVLLKELVLSASSPGYAEAWLRSQLNGRKVTCYSLSSFVFATRVRFLYRVLCALSFAALIAGVVIQFFSLVSKDSGLWLPITIAVVLEDLLILQPLDILARHVVINSGVTAEFVRIIESLKTRRRLISIRSSGVMRGIDSFLQHFNPACRAARMFPHLEVSRFIYAINDYDVRETMTGTTSVAVLGQKGRRRSSLGSISMRQSNGINAAPNNETSIFSKYLLLGLSCLLWVMPLAGLDALLSLVFYVCVNLFIVGCAWTPAFIAALGCLLVIAFLLRRVRLESKRRQAEQQRHARDKYLFYSDEELEKYSPSVKQKKATSPLEKFRVASSLRPKGEVNRVVPIDVKARSANEFKSSSRPPTGGGMDSIGFLRPARLFMDQSGGSASMSQSQRPQSAQVTSQRAQAETNRRPQSARAGGGAGNASSKSSKFDVETMQVKPKMAGVDGHLSYNREENKYNDAEILMEDMMIQGHDAGEDPDYMYQVHRPVSAHGTIATPGQSPQHMLLARNPFQLMDTMGSTVEIGDSNIHGASAITMSPRIMPSPRNLHSGGPTPKGSPSHGQQGSSRPGTALRSEPMLVGEPIRQPPLSARQILDSRETAVALATSNDGANNATIPSLRWDQEEVLAKNHMSPSGGAGGTANATDRSRLASARTIARERRRREQVWREQQGAGAENEVETALEVVVKEKIAEDGYIPNSFLARVQSSSSPIRGSQQQQQAQRGQQVPSPTPMAGTFEESKNRSSSNRHKHRHHKRHGHGHGHHRDDHDASEGAAQDSGDNNERPMAPIRSAPNLLSAAVDMNPYANLSVKASAGAGVGASGDEYERDHRRRRRPMSAAEDVVSLTPHRQQPRGGARPQTAARLQGQGQGQGQGLGNRGGAPHQFQQEEKDNGGNNYGVTTLLSDPPVDSYGIYDESLMPSLEYMLAGVHHTDFGDGPPELGRGGGGGASSAGQQGQQVRQTRFPQSKSARVASSTTPVKAEDTKYPLFF